MCHFLCLSSINGVPACANHKLLTEILRDEWNFTGYVVSDESALERIVNDHHYVKDYATAAIDIINAGVNLEVSHNNPNNVFMNLGNEKENNLTIVKGRL
jgi:beta-glucosidase